MVFVAQDRLPHGKNLENTLKFFNFLEIPLDIFYNKKKIFDVFFMFASVHFGRKTFDDGFSRNQKFTVGIPMQFLK